MDEQEINDIIAEKAMQWHQVKVTDIWGSTQQWCNHTGEFMAWHDSWRPTRNIGQAWQVAKKMCEYTNAANRFEISGSVDLFSCRFLQFHGIGAPRTLGFSTDQPTVQMAICLAVLDCLGIELEDKKDKNAEKETS